MKAKVIRENKSIKRAHNTRSLLEALGIHLTGNEFLGLIKNCESVEQTYDLTPASAMITYSNKEPLIRGKITYNVDDSHANMKRRVCNCLSEKQPYFTDTDVKTGHLSKFPCNSEIYFKDGNYHIAYF